MASNSTAFSILQFKYISQQPVICNVKHQISPNAIKFQIKVRFKSSNLKSNPRKLSPNFSVRAVANSENSNDKLVRDRVEMLGRASDPKFLFISLRESINALPPIIILTMKRSTGTNFAIGLFIAISLLVIAVREISARKAEYKQHGSVADLVKRGQLRSDRRGISRPLKYDDPFNNPLVKVGKGNSTIEMCGKVYRLAPVTLTEEQQSIHQTRRSRAYQWKRPTVFLKEGDAIPPDVDPDTIRWIPANHPFATTVNDIDENLAQNNVYQKDGVPFRIKAEHNALQRKLEALQSEQKLNKMAIDPSSIREFERPFKSFSKAQEQVEQNQHPANHQGTHTNTSKSDTELDCFENNATSEELKKP